MKRISLILGVFLLTSCADRQNALSNLGIQVAQGSVSAQLALSEPGKLTVVDEGNKPVPNATVLIGQSAGNPFEGNVAVTDASGQIHMPSNFKSELPMTVSADGYITQTYLRFAPTGTLAQLHKKEGANRIEVRGTTTNFSGVVDGDGKIDFGLVIPSMTKTQLLAFDLSSVLSPENDTITIMGRDVNIPSNLTLPEQSESYDIIIPVNLNKPTYRSFLREGGSRHFSGVHGWFPLKKVVDDIRGGKSFFDVINSFQFTTMGSRDVAATESINGQDINVNQMAMDASFPVRAPAFDTSKVMLSLAMAEDNGRLTVTDLKRLNPKQTLQLKSSSRLSSRRMLSALVNNNRTDASPAPVNPGTLLPIDGSALFSAIPNLVASPNFQQLSFVFQNEGDGAPTFLPMVSAPSMSGNVVQLQAPQLPAGLRVLGTYLVYSEILPSNGGSVKSETRTRLWELWNDGWVNTVTLPEVSFAKTPGRTYRWEVMFLATSNSSDEVTTDGSALNVNNITHVSRNALNAN
jgi:hypothetical protein